MHFMHGMHGGQSLCESSISSCNAHAEDIRCSLVQFGRSDFSTSERNARRTAGYETLVHWICFADLLRNLVHSGGGWGVRGIIVALLEGWFDRQARKREGGVAALLGHALRRMRSGGKEFGAVRMIGEELCYATALARC